MNSWYVINRPMEMKTFFPSEAAAIQPDKPTFVIRIVNTENLESLRKNRLQESELYRRKVTYEFDSFDSHYGSIMPDQLADQVLDDFDHEVHGFKALECECLLVSSQTWGHDFTVALTLDEIFYLGISTQKRREMLKDIKKPIYWEIHDSLRRAAKRRKIRTMPTTSQLRLYFECG